MRPYLSIIIPAYNEEKRLPATLASIQDYLASVPWNWELLVVDDGSRDQTTHAAHTAFRSPRCRIIESPRNQGKGAAIRLGMLQATGKFRLFTDADNSTPIEEVEKLLEVMKRHRAHVAIASRALPGSELEQRQPFHREMMGRAFNLIVRTIALPGIHDTQCGFKMFTAKAAEEIFPRQQMPGFSFDVELLLLARQHGFRIAEVPVRWIDNPDSRVSPVKDSLRVFRDVVRIRWRLMKER